MDTAYMPFTPHPYLAKAPLSNLPIHNIALHLRHRHIAHLLLPPNGLFPRYKALLATPPYRRATPATDLPS